MNIDGNTAAIVFAAAAGALALGLIAALWLLRRVGRAQKEGLSDTVTGLLSPQGLEQAAARCLPAQSGSYAVVVMGLENYGALCDAFGIEAAERVLRHLAGLLSANLSAQEPAGRLSGGTFCFLMKNRREDELRARLERIYEGANAFNKGRYVPCRLSLCFGISLPQGGESFRELQEKAALRLEADSDERIRFHTGAQRLEAARGWELAGQLEGAIAGGEMVVHLQPKVRLSDSRIAGAEAFVRWRHPKRGMLTSAMFVPLLEEYSLLHRLDAFVVDTVCRKMAAWLNEGCSPCPVSINLSLDSMEQPDFPQAYGEICRSHGIDTALIEFELNDKILSQPVAKLRDIIDRIHAGGFRCSLDNFGRASFPMSLLRELDVDAVKLDRGFFHVENNSRRNRFVVEAILKLASQMHISTVAEGIENASQVRYLQQAGCDMIQGFYYFKPMTVEEFRHTAWQDGQLCRVAAADGGIQPPQDASASEIVMFSVSLGEDTARFSHAFSPAFEGELVIRDAGAFFTHSGLIHENDRVDFARMLERCKREEGWLENSLRFMTAPDRYEWLELRMHRESWQNGGALISGTLVNTSGWKNELKLWKDKASRDGLTGLYNRVYFEQTVAAALEKEPAAAALVFVDVDDFKRVNDTMGHMVGDDVLRFVSQQLLGQFSHTDLVGRYAGDEFVAFVQGADRGELERALDDLCRRFTVPYRSGNVEYPVSISVGAAMFPRDGDSYGRLLKAADAALYAAKEHGKNVYVFYRPGM